MASRANTRSPLRFLAPALLFVLGGLPAWANAAEGRAPGTDTPYGAAEASEALKLRYDVTAPRPHDKGDGFTGRFLSAIGSERFSLMLTQNGDELTGYHSVSLQKGDRTDGEGSSSQPSIHGTVNGPIVVVRFRGGLPGSDAWGHARLTLRDRYLYWQLIDAYGDHLLPQNAVLIRQ